MKIERIYLNEVKLEYILTELFKNQIDDALKSVYVNNDTTASHDYEGDKSWDWYLQIIWTNRRLTKIHPLKHGVQKI